MANGWFCIWRKIEDNVSWSRGIEYRGLMITILQKANWKQGFFMGQKIEPGQLPTSAANLATELKISRQKCQRMVSKLSDDGFISVSNMSNRFTMITVVNWDIYQSKDKLSEQPVSNQRATTGQPPGTIEQSNKVTIEQKDSLPPTGGDSGPLKKISPEIVEFVKTFNGYIDGKFEKSAPKRSDKSFVADCDSIRLAMKVDGFSLEDIKSSLRWAHGDGFWQDQIKSLSQIRKKGDDGTSKLQKIYQKAMQQPQQTSFSDQVKSEIKKPKKSIEELIG